MSTRRVKIRIDVEYDGDTIQDMDHLLEDVRYNVNYAVNDGLLTESNTTVEVDTWEVTVTDEDARELYKECSMTVYMPAEGSRWIRGDNAFDSDSMDYNAYTVVAITNVGHRHERHPPQVVYQGDNGHWWSLPLTDWPGRLVPES